MISFNPGPTQLFPGVSSDIEEIVQSGLLATSHRSDFFEEIAQEAFQGLRANFDIPSDYSIFFQTSATDAMSTVLFNFAQRDTFHFVHGAFSKRFSAMAEGIGLKTTVHETEMNAAVNWEDAEIDPKTELITIITNETSTGLAWPQEVLKKVRKRWSSPLICHDITSQFGAVPIDWSDADVWIFPIQKCLGLPSGLGFLIASPRALECAKPDGVPIDKRLLSFKYPHRTVQTPNMLGICLVAKLMRRWKAKEIFDRIQRQKEYLDHPPSGLTHFIIDPVWRSSTVGNYLTEEPQKLVEALKEQGILIGKGYGPLKQSCVRIANYPALGEKEFELLFKAINAYV